MKQTIVFTPHHTFCKSFRSRTYEVHSFSETLTPTTPLVDSSCCNGSAILSAISGVEMDPRITPSHTRNKPRGIAVPRTMAVLKIENLMNSLCTTIQEEDHNSWHNPILGHSQILFSFSKKKKTCTVPFWTALCSFFSPANAETGENEIFENFSR